MNNIKQYYPTLQCNEQYYAQYIGGIECVDRVLNLQLSDLVEEDDERNQREQMDTSGVSDQS